jgi:hypothetical protein
MPTLPDVGRLGGGPYAGPGRAQVRMAVRGEEDADPGVWEVFAVGRGDGFVVRGLGRGHSEGGQRAAPGRRGPVWATVEAPGWPATGPERHRAGVVGASCGVVPPLMPRMRRILPSGSEDAKVRRWNATTGQPIGQPIVTDQSVQAPRRWLKRAGSPHPVQRENGAIRRGVRPPARPGAPPRLPPAPAPRRRDRRPGSRPRDWWRSARGPGRPGPNTSKVPPRGAGRRRSRPPVGWWSGRRPLGEMPPGAGYSLCPGAYPTNALDPHPCRSPAQELGVRDPATSQLAVLGSSLGRAGAAG